MHRRQSRIAFLNPSYTTSFIQRARNTTCTIHNRYASQVAIAKMTLKADLDHIALDCKDTDAMVKFYTETLDFEFMQMSDAPFPSVRLSDTTIIDFFTAESGGGLNNTNHFCMSIKKEDYKGLKGRLNKAGIETPEPKLRGGAKGRGWSVYIRDPEENMLEFRWYD